MDKVLVQLLTQQYPFMSRAYHQGTDYGHAGMSTPDGWFPLLVEFADAVVEVQPKSLVIYSIKEKWNRLEICCEDDADEGKQQVLDDLVDIIEERSLSLCGRCGEILEEEHDCDGLSWSEVERLAWAERYLHK